MHIDVPCLSPFLWLWHIILTYCLTAWCLSKCDSKGQTMGDAPCGLTCRAPVKDAPSLLKKPTKTQEVKARMESIQAMQKDAKGIKIRPTRAVLLSPSLGVSRSLYVGYVWDLQLFLCHANSHNTCCGQTCLEVQYPCDFSWLLEKNRCIRGSVVESQI